MEKKILGASLVFIFSIGFICGHFYNEFKDGWGPFPKESLHPVFVVSRVYYVDPCYGEIILVLPLNSVVVVVLNLNPSIPYCFQETMIGRSRAFVNITQLVINYINHFEHELIVYYYNTSWYENWGVVGFVSPYYIYEEA